jgi:hypothetical protein
VSGLGYSRPQHIYSIKETGMRASPSNHGARPDAASNSGRSKDNQKGSGLHRSRWPLPGLSRVQLPPLPLRQSYIKRGIDAKTIGTSRPCCGRIDL